MNEENIIEIGKVGHFFSKISVVIIDLMLPLTVGDRVLIKGPLTDFEQTVTSMEIDHKEIQVANGGQSIGLKLIQVAKEKDVVYRKL